MKVDGGLGFDLAGASEAARDAEAAGYDGVWTAEAGHDPFLPLVLAAEHTERLELGTGIAVAFPRSPMHLAMIGQDLQQYSGGRLLLGLGSQIKAHIEKRFSATWSHPAPRMRELILAMRAIWSSWNDGTKLDFRGDFYTHTLMTPFFNPGPCAFGPPKVFLAAVGEKMTEVAGEVADGLLAHAFTTEPYLRQVTMPALERGLARSGRKRADLQISCPVFIISGATEQERAAAEKGTREQIAFYASTPAYRGVLDLHGWGALGEELNRLSKLGQWVEMGRLIEDDVVDAFAVRGQPEDVPRLLAERYDGLIDRVSFYAPYRSDPERWTKVLAGFKQPAA
ncbi:MAG: LLM class F420-dependent oxidoreductase [Acidimicrobiales bacterium]